MLQYMRSQRVGHNLVTDYNNLSFSLPRCRKSRGEQLKYKMVYIARDVDEE